MVEMFDIGLHQTKPLGRAGGLMAYGVDLLNMFRQAGGMVGKVLSGAKPAFE